MHIQVVVTGQPPPIPEINIVTNPRRDRHSNCHIIIQDQELRTLLTFSKSLHQALKSFSLDEQILRLCSWFICSRSRVTISNQYAGLQFPIFAPCCIMQNVPVMTTRAFYSSSSRPGLFFIFFCSPDQQHNHLLHGARAGTGKTLANKNKRIRAAANRSSLGIFCCHYRALICCSEKIIRLIVEQDYYKVF